MFGVPSPYAAGELTPHLMLLADYAHKPLVLRSDPADEERGSVVKNQLFLHLNLGLALWNRLNLDLSVPVALAQSGDDPSVGGQLFASPNSAQFGDLRFGARLRLAGEYHDPFQVAVGGNLWAPTGASDSFVSSGKARGLAQLILGGRIDERVVWSAAGPEFQPKSTFANVEQGTMFKWGAGLGFLLLDNRHLQIGPEIYGAATLRDVQKRTTNAELLLDVRYRVVDDLEIAAGAGPGLTSGIGTPDFRGLFSVAYTPEQKQEHEPIATPEAPPAPKDRDLDGILDADDACPDVKGIADEDPKKNGCPPPPEPVDTDGDGIFDPDDACPEVKGVADPDPKKNGCPPPPKDSDGDGIFDPDDACPAEKGAHDEDPAKNGCPKSVRVTANEIVILEQVQFDTGKATIKPESAALLDEVGQVLTRGVSAERLVAKGYGPDKPIEDNATDAGRQKNRRVQFVIVETKPKETL